MNKNSVLIAIVILIGFISNAQNQTHIISHDGETIVTDPSKGRNSYKRNVVFPKKNVEIRSIILNLNL